MKSSIKLIMIILSGLLFSQSISAFAQSQNGEITFYNTSQKSVTAKVNSHQFTLKRNENKSISYSTLSQICSSKRCTAYFYADNNPVGFATINVETGKLNHQNLELKIKTLKNQHVLRGVVIK